jgi:hypothetical protein
MSQNRPRFQYIFVELHQTAGGHMVDDLNRLAAKGWRLVNLETDTLVRWRLLLEREVFDDQEEDDDGRREMALLGPRGVG